MFQDPWLRDRPQLASDRSRGLVPLSAPWHLVARWEDRAGGGDAGTGLLLPNAGCLFSETSGRWRGVLGAHREGGLGRGNWKTLATPEAGVHLRARRGCAAVLSPALFRFPASRPHSPGLAPPPQASGTTGVGGGGLGRRQPKASVEGRRVLVVWERTDFCTKIKFGGFVDCFCFGMRLQTCLICLQLLALCLCSKTKKDERQEKGVAFRREELVPAVVPGPVPGEGADWQPRLPAPFTS